MPRQDPDIPAAFARVRSRDRRLGPWMTRHHDTLMRELGSGRIAWRDPLAVFASLGLTDEHGRPLTRDTASRTWRRVRTAVAAARQAQASVAPRPGELVRGVRLATPPARPATPLPSSLLPSARVAPGAASPVEGVEEATERIQVVLHAMGAARVPLPRQPSRIMPVADARPAPDRTDEP